MLVVVVHNIYSSVKLSEVFDVVLSFPEVDLFVVSKASSSAAQSGVPETEKKAFMRGRRVLFVPDINDVNELLRPDLHLMVVPKRLAKEKLVVNDIRRMLDEGKTIVVSIAGGDSTFTLKELEAGKPVHIGFDDILPPSATLGVILYSLFPR